MRTTDLPRAERNRVLEGLSANLSKRGEILFAYAYGSFLKEERFRDLDVAVWVQREKLQVTSFRYEDRLAGELTRELKLTFPLDLRIMNEAPLSFQYRVFQGRLLLDREPDYRIELVTLTVARYLDLKPFLYGFLKEAYGFET